DDIGFTKDGPAVGQQSNSKTWLGLPGSRNKRNSRFACPLWPFPADCIGNRKKRLPAVGRAVFDPGRHIWASVGKSLGSPLGPTPPKYRAVDAPDGNDPDGDRVRRPRPRVGGAFE